MARHLSQVVWHIIQSEPANFAALFGFHYRGRAFDNPADVRRRNPMLLFFRQDVIGYGEQFADRDSYAIFLTDFTVQGVVERLAKFNRAAGKFP